MSMDELAAARRVEKFTRPLFFSRNFRSRNFLGDAFSPRATCDVSSELGDAHACASLTTYASVACADGIHAFLS
jgi:hypothetical protein